ncbi:MAG: nicotinate-nicotinamide nucleotide adenylyltransferase [Sulfurimonas sp.]|jgi:nicotinate-nucleotide adenylyltransferase|nr:nicotinate-nicotinamide nucleotide adenylyltransferase [Sulfurimonadaceae bacterium]
MQKEKSVALFGGSFDPPHLGHIKAIESLCALEFIDRVVVMPTFLNPFKSCFFAPPKLRLKWLREIFKSNKKVEISSFEVDKNRPTPTIESVFYLQKSYDNIYVVIGADNLAKLHTWHRFDELEKIVKFIVLKRENIDPTQEYININIDVDISSSALRDEPKKEFLPSAFADEIYSYYKEKNCKKD